MTNLRQKYGVDPEKERNGIRVELDECVFIVRRMGGNNHAWRYALAQPMERHRPEIMNGKEANERHRADLLATFEATEHSLQDAFVDHLLRRAGRTSPTMTAQPLPFSQEAAAALLVECPDVWIQLRNAAQTIDSFRKEDVRKLGES